MIRRVNRSAIVPYRSQQMFALVDDVESYPQFLPWCTSAAVHSRSDDVLEATLELQKGGMRNQFTTRNTRVPHSAIELELVGGPFRLLDGGWRFKELADQGCKVTLQLDFEFESMMVDMMFGRFFEDTCNSLVDAFTRRAEEVFDRGS